jgi:hypothetical protein
MIEQNVVVGGDETIEAEVMPIDKSKARKFAESRGKDLIDVTPYVDEKEADKGVRSANIPKEEDDDIPDPLIATSAEPEAWGMEAKIVDDYEGRSIVVDNLNRFVVEFKGSNQSTCQAFVVASRDALKNFLAGGSRSQNVTSAEETDIAQTIQAKRQEAAKVPSSRKPTNCFSRPRNMTIEGYFKDISTPQNFRIGVHVTQQQVLSLPAGEPARSPACLTGVHRKPFSAKRHAVPLRVRKLLSNVSLSLSQWLPDVFRRSALEEPAGRSTGLNEAGETYEQWRWQDHDELRVNVDIRAAAACLRRAIR